MDINIGSMDFDKLKLIDETGQFVEYNLRVELAVNEGNLLQEMLQQPSKYIYWSSILEKIKMFQESKELELEQVVAGLDKDAREAIIKEGGKPTKDTVDAYIKRQPDWVAAKKECQSFEHIAGRVGRIVKAFEQRKDMLQSYGKQIVDQKYYGGGAGSRLEDNVNPQMPNS